MRKLLKWCKKKLTYFCHTAIYLFVFLVDMQSLFLLFQEFSQTRSTYVDYYRSFPYLLMFSILYMLSDGIYTFETDIGVLSPNITWFFLIFLLTMRDKTIILTGPFLAWMLVQAAWILTSSKNAGISLFYPILSYRIRINISYNRMLMFVLIGTIPAQLYLSGFLSFILRMLF